MACFFITASYDNKPAAKYFFALANALVAGGHQVVLIVPPHAEIAENQTTNPQIFTWASKRPTHWRDALFLHKLIIRLRPDCLISTFASVNITTLVGWVNRVPHRVVWYRTMSKALDLDHDLPVWKTFFYRFRKRLVYRFATHFVANSRAAAADLQAVYLVKKDKCSVLHFLIADPKVNRSDVQTDVQTTKLICVGRLHRCKGQETLIRAIAKLKNVFPQLTAEFIGGGPEKSNYETLAKSLGVQNNCDFLGSIASKEVFERMAAAAICIVPSVNEALGWVNIEAQSVGTPVVASAIDGIKEVIVDGETGFLVPVNNVEAFADKIGCLLTNDALRQQFGLQARAHFEKNFSIEHISRHADFFERLISPKL